jgi:ATP-binding cassette, subfamily B, bacterial
MSFDAQDEPEAESYSLGKLYRALWRYAAEDRPRVILFAALLLAAQAIRLTIPYFTGEAVNAMQVAGVAGLHDAARYMTLIFIAAMFGWVLHGPARVVERFVAAGIRRRFTDALYAKVVSQPMSWHESHHSGDTILRVEKATLALFNFAQNQFVYLQNAVSLVGPIVAIFFLSTITGIAALAGYLVIAIVLVKFDGAMVRLNREGNEAERHYSAALVDCLGNISTVIALRLQRATQRMLGQRLDDVFRPLRQSIVVKDAAP